MLVATLGGPQEALIIGTRQRAPAQYAALANGAAGHGEEVDGAHVIVHVDADLDRDNPQGRGANVTIRTTSGSSFSHRVDAPRGHSSRGGVTRDELRDKWRDGLPDCDVERMLSLAQRLEHLEDVKELADAFVSPH